MSDVTVAMLACPQCAFQNEVRIWKSVNIQLNPELKPLIMRGTLNSFECGQCHEEVTINAGFFYHDMEKKTMIYFLGDGTPDTIEQRLAELRTIDRMVGIEKYSQIFSSYQLRYVFRHSDLQEKIRILDTGFDDRVMELLKAIIYPGLREKSGIDLTDIFFIGRDEQIKFALLDGSGTQYETALPSSSLYDATARDVSEKIAEVFPVGVYHIVSMATVSRAFGSTG